MTEERMTAAKDEDGVPTIDVRGWTTHDTPVRLFYHGETLGLLEVVLQESNHREPKGGPQRRSTVRIGDLRKALDALAALPPTVPPVVFARFLGPTRLTIREIGFDLDNPPIVIPAGHHADLLIFPTTTPETK